MTLPRQLQLQVASYGPDFWEDQRSDWCRLWELDPLASGFLSPQWVEAWLHCFGPWLEPVAVRWIDGSGTLRAIALFSMRRERLGPLRIRAAYLNTTGEHRVLAEHNRILTQPGYEQAVAETLPALLRSRGIHALRLSGFSSAEVARYQGAWQGCWRESMASEDRYVDLRPYHANPGDYLSALSRNTREQVRRSLKLYEREGDALTCTVVSGPARSQALKELADLHGALWQGRGKQGAFADPTALAMHKRLLLADGQGDHCRAELLRIGNATQCIGYLYMLVCRGQVSFYQSGFRYETDARLKPGLVSHVLAIQHYAACGEQEYDFLAGEIIASRYKRSLGPLTRQLEWSDLYAPGTPVRWLLPLRKYLRIARDYVKRRDLRGRHGA